MVLLTEVSEKLFVSLNFIFPFNSVKEKWGINGPAVIPEIETIVFS